MPRKRKAKRAFKLIAFKAYHDTDQDILDWWEGIEDGERSDALRDLIRSQLGVQRQSENTTEIELLAVRRDTVWIRDALNDLPVYLEQLMHELSANGPPIPNGQPPARASPANHVDDPALTDAEAQRRTRRLKRATW